MKRYLAVIGIAVLAILIGLWAAGMRLATPPMATGCTTEALICPDGSAVGRTGPNCEFAACPAIATTTTPLGPNSLTIQAKIGQEVALPALDMKFTLLEVLEDSRCPVDVQCIQAGTVRVKTSVTRNASGNQYTTEFKLGQVLSVASTEREIGTLLLTEVQPIKKSTVQINSSDYIFTFKMEKRTASSSGSIAPYNSGVRGNVLLGPTCPVMRDPPDPQCADKPYATTINVRRSGSTSIYAAGKSSADGTFQFALPPGSYTITATGGATLPRCSDASVTVGATGYATTTIFCDTGIR